MYPHDSQAPGDHGILGPRHQVFFCHSGAQKGFVWQLDEDLRRYDLHPFFDRDRDSLPIGRDFPNLICKAIEQCQVGIVFLSEEFFTLSHWPMFELVKMVECGREIMPIFLGISPEDLSKEENLQRWILQWQEWEKCNERIDVLAWERAVKLLRPLNGLKYVHEAGVVAFRKSIVMEIMRKVRPSYEWDDSHVQGRSRLSQTLQEKIKSRMCQSGVQEVGLYGVGGIGKTTACKSLCADLFMDFDGRVCHVELGNDTTEKERVQDVLTKLTNISEEFLKDKKSDECWSMLKKHLHLNKFFLAIDNVLGRNSIEEAKKYLKIGYCQGSIVVVTTRARGDLIDLRIDDRDCHEIPELDASEAKSLFLYHAEPKGEVDERVLMSCINRCYFSKGDVRSFHYHPLALKVLGSELAGVDFKEWTLRLGEVDVFNLRREQENGVFSILRRSFDVLVDEDKFLFMDVALFDIAQWYKEWRSYSEHYNLSELIDTTRTWYIFEWLSLVHGLSLDDLKKRLDSLKKKSLLEDLGDGTTQIGMHDLWREFAVMETKHGEVKGGRWVYELVGGEAEDSSLSGGGWKDVRRICVMRELALQWDRRCVVKSLNLSDCSRVTVLKLVDVEVENQALDLSALKQLKSLEIVPPVVRYGNSKVVLKMTGIGFLTNLRVLIWLGICEESIRAVEEISRLTNLQVLQLRGDISPMFDLRQLRWLREVRVELSMESIWGLSSIMTDLRILDLRGCGELRSCPGVGDVVGLEQLLLSWCVRLGELPDLQKLTKLRILDTHGCVALEAISGLGGLGVLQELQAGVFCQNPNENPDMSNLTNLEVLDLQDCFRLKCIPGLGNLFALRELFINVGSLNEWPDRGNLRQLHTARICGLGEDLFGVCKNEESNSEDDALNPQELHVLNLAILESVSKLSLEDVDHELTNFSKLTALKSLHLRRCSLERLPHMGKHVRLESLIISGCEWLSGWDGVGTLLGSSESQTGVDLHCDWTLPHLEELLLWNSGVVELPDLSHFPRLRKLTMNNDIRTSPSRRWSNYAVLCLATHMQLETLECSYSPITELPDLRKSPCLKELNLDNCDKLTSLTISGPLTALESIILEGCSNLYTLPSIDLLPSLRFLRIENCGVELNKQEVANLISRGFRFIFSSHWAFNPEPARNEIILDNEPNCKFSGVQLSLDGPDDVAGPSSRVSEPSSSEFIPYEEFISECAPVPKRSRHQFKEYQN